MKKIVLASGSKFKADVFREFMKKSELEVEFDICRSSLGDADERKIVDEIIDGVSKISAELAAQAASTLALKKAEDVFEKLGRPADTLVIGADSVVLHNNKILDKYKSMAEAEQGVFELCNQNHYVITGMAFVSAAGKEAAADVILMKSAGATREECVAWVRDAGEAFICSTCGYGFDKKELKRLFNLNEDDMDANIGLSTRMIREYLGRE